MLITGGLLAVGIIGAAATPQDDNKKPAAANTAPAALAAPKVAKVTLLSPDDGTTVQAHSVLVRGSVSPATADVQVGGDPASVSGGRFIARVPLDLGENTVDVSVAQAGFESGSAAVSITRERTAREQAALQKRQRERRLAAERRRAEERAAAERRERQRIAAQTKTFSGSGSKSIGTITVSEESILEWTNNDDPEFRQMLIYDDGFDLSVSSDAGSGDTVVPPGTYRNITVAGGSSWTLRIHPR